MYRFKNIITAFVLLLILAIPIFFSVLVLIKQQITQLQRNEKFSKVILQTITVSSTAIYWVKPEKEIMYNGKLFDVKSYSKNGSCITFTGFFDMKEDKLLQQIVKLAMQKNKTGNPFNQPVIEFLFFQSYIIQHQISFDICWKFVSRQYHRFDEWIPTAPCRLPIQPPC